jgi:hypothetical protein
MTVNELKAKLEKADQAGYGEAPVVFMGVSTFFAPAGVRNEIEEVSVHHLGTPIIDSADDFNPSTDDYEVRLA